MPTYQLTLSAEASRSYRCQRAANSLDIDVAKKLTHTFSVTADLETPFHVGVLVGASGSGKTTLAKHVWGDAVHDGYRADPARPVLDQFPAEWTYDQCQAALTGIGLTSVPTWLRPLATLSNGQRARAEAALAIANTPADQPLVLDEWTSVVDRIVARVMSHCLAKHARRAKAQVVLLTCHYDVLEWLDPDWVIDCNTQTFHDRRGLPAADRARREQLTFDVREVDRRTWRAFRQYHYLSDKLPGGYIRTFGLFHDGKQIGFQCLAEYMPWKPGTVRTLHSNRTVIHPDYAGLGLGILLIDASCALIKREGLRPLAKFSAEPVFRAMSRSPNWRFREAKQNLGTGIVVGNRMKRGGGFRTNVKTYHFEYIGPADPAQAIAVARAAR